MNKNFNSLMLILVIALGLMLTNCKKSSDSGGTPDPYVLKLGSSATLGSYLTDKSGNALYFFSNDAAGANTCTGGCTTNWPIFNVSGLTQAKLATGLTLGDFDSITTASGMQLTYKGWPLYYYAPGGTREAPGVTSGDGVGGVWFVAKPDYTIMLANMQLVGANGKSYVVSPDNVYSEGTGNTTYFTDQAGRTLYAFAKDSANINKFTKADFSNNSVWPIYEVSQAVVPSILDKNLFSTISVYGHTQMTYKTRPLYYFGPDVNTVTGKFRGYNKGVSVGATIGTWPILYKDIPPAPAPAGGGGY